jgi:branched-chain amino acid transport system permease protein
VLAVLLGGAVAAPFGIVLGFLTIRMGDLYVALVTLVFGLLLEDLVFSRQIFQNSGIGITVTPPHFASGARVFVWCSLVVFALVALLIVNLRRSTTGLALNAVRWSESGSKTIGISVLVMKVLVAGLAAFVAGLGGAMLALSLGVALSANYATLVGVVWLAVLVTLGIRSNVAALLAGISSTILPGIVLTYLPNVWGNVPPILFGLGAIAVAKYPEGTLAMQARQIRWVSVKLVRREVPGASRKPPTAAVGISSTSKPDATGATASVTDASRIAPS